MFHKNKIYVIVIKKPKKGMEQKMKHAQNSEIKSKSRARRVTRDGNVKKKKKIIKIFATLVRESD